MRLIPNVTFLEWLSANGVVQDPRYPASHCLTFAAAADAQSRFWDHPPDQSQHRHFMEHIIAGAGAWHELYVWPRGGCWCNWPTRSSRLEEIEIRLKFGPPVLDQFEGALAYAAEEQAQLLELMVRNLAEGKTSFEDLFLVPDNASYILQTDHHGVVHIGCQTAAQMDHFVSHMADKGFMLPTELLDWTFKQPAWMK